MWGGEIKGGLLCSTLRAWKVSAGLQEVHSSEGLQRRQSSEEDFFNFGPEVGLPAVFFPADNMLELKLAVLLGEFHFSSLLFCFSRIYCTYFNDCSSVRNQFV